MPRGRRWPSLCNAAGGASADERRAALALAKELGCLPLALAYAAAYIARKEIPFAHYLELYKEQRLALLDGKDAGDAEPQHAPLRAVWEMNINALKQDWGTKQAGAYARDLLDFCAFIGPDDIFCELVLLGAKEYCPPLYELIAPLRGDAPTTKPCGAAEQAVFHDLLQPLIQYSLVTKNLESPRFSLHRLLQEVIADSLGNAKRAWQEKVVRALNSVFPVPEPENWQSCERFLPHALAVAEMILKEGLATLEAGRLLHHIGVSLTHQGRYDAAYLYMHTAQNIWQRFADTRPLDLADSLHGLGNICQYQHNLVDARKWYEAALTLLRRQTPPDERRVLHISNDQAALLNSQSLWKQAEAVYTGMLDAAQDVFGDDAHLACFHHNLGWSYYGQARYAAAADCYHLAMKIWNASPTKDSFPIAGTWHDLAQAYRKLGRAQAEEFYLKALTIQRKTYPGGHSRTAVTLYNIGEMYRERTQYDRAEKFYRDALNMDVKVSGRIHCDAAVDLKALAELYRLMDRQADADKMQRRADAILQKLADNAPPPNDAAAGAL